MLCCDCKVGWDEYELTFSVGLDPVAALAAVELLVVVVDRRSSATEGGAVGAAAEPRRALLLAAPDLGSRRLVGTAVALAALPGQVPRQGHALRVYFPVEDLEDLQNQMSKMLLYFKTVSSFFRIRQNGKSSSNQLVNSRVNGTTIIWNVKRVISTVVPRKI